MKDNDFEKLLQDSIKLFGHEYPEPPTNDISETHRFPDNFLDDIIPHTKPKKPFILRHIRAISAAAAVMVIGLAAVLVASNTGTRNMNDMIDKTSPNSTAVMEDTKPDIKQSSGAIKNHEKDTNSIKENSTKTPVSSVTDPAKSDEHDNTGITDDKTSKDIHAETSAEVSHEAQGEIPAEESHKTHEEIPAEVSHKIHEDMPIETSEEEHGVMPYEPSEDIHTEASSEPSEHETVNYTSFSYNENADDPINTGIRNIVTDAKKYMTDDYAIDVSSFSLLDIKYSYIFTPLENADSFNIDGTDFRQIMIEKTDDGYILSTLYDVEFRSYFIGSSEEIYTFIESTLQNMAG